MSWIVRSTLLILLLLLVAGCDSAQDDSFVVTGNSGALAAQSRLAAQGRVKTDAPVAGATVVATALDGEPLAGPVQTDSTGGFNFKGQLPADYRVVATLPGSSETLAAEVRQAVDNQSAPLISINVVTNLVSREMANHPNLSKAQAEQAIREALGIPPHVDLGFGLGESRYSPFSHTAFLQQAASSGGIAALSESVLATADAGQTVRFVRSRQVLGQILIPDGAAGSALGDLLGGLLGAAKNTMIGNIITDATKSLYGWAAGAFGWNFGTAGELSAIENQLDGISAQITALSNQINSDFTSLETIIDKDSLVDSLQSQKNNLGQGVITSLDTNIELLTTQLQAVTPSNQPAPLSSGVSGLLDTFQSQATYNATVDQINTLSESLLGQNLTLNLTSTLMSINEIGMGLSTDQLRGANQFYDLRRNDILYSCLDQLEFYQAAQTKGYYLLAELAHTQPSLASSINSTLQVLDGLEQTLKQERQQLPDPLPSDDFFVDLENGLVWYLAARPLWDTPSFPLSDPPFGYSWDLTAYSQLASIPIQIGDIPLTFRLPYQSEMDTLIARAKQANANNGGQPVTTGSKTQEVLPGLQYLGFTGLPNLSDPMVDGQVPTFADRGFYLPVIPEEDSSTSEYVNPFFITQSGAKDQNGTPLVPGGYLSPTFYFSGDNDYHFEEGAAVQGYQQLQGFPFPTYESVLPGNDPGYALYVAPLYTETVMHYNLPFSTPTPLPAPTSIFIGLDPNITGPAQAAPLLRSMFTPTSLQVQSTPTQLTVTGTYELPEDAFGPRIYTGVDLTDRVSFKGDKNVSVSNLTGGQVADPTDPSKQVTLPSSNGGLTWHTDDTSLTGTIVASLIVGYTGSADSNGNPPGLSSLSLTIPYGGTASLQTNLTAPPALRSLMVTPTNQLVNTTSDGFNVMSLYVTGFYSDNTVQDLTNQVSWEILDGDSPVSSTLASVNPSNTGQLNLSQNLGISTLTVKAALGAVTGQATIGTAFP